MFSVKSRRKIRGVKKKTPLILVPKKITGTEHKTKKTYKKNAVGTTNYAITDKPPITPEQRENEFAGTPPFE